MCDLFGAGARGRESSLLQAEATDTPICAFDVENEKEERIEFRLFGLLMGLIRL